VEDGAVVDGLSFPQAAPQIEPAAVQKHHVIPNTSEEANDETTPP
jgi:hypothetical protein